MARSLELKKVSETLNKYIKKLTKFEKSKVRLCSVIEYRKD